MLRGRPLQPVPLWTPKFSRENLVRLSKNKEAFDRGFRMEAISPGDLLFPSFEGCYQSGVHLDEILQRRLPAYVGVDLAGDKRPGNCIFVAGHDEVKGHRYALEVLYGAWLSPETAGHIAAVDARHNVRVIQVENNAYQSSLIQWIRSEQGRHSSIWPKIQAFTTGMNKSHPEYGLAGMEIEFKNKAWVFASSAWKDHESTCTCGWCHFAREVAMYPRYPTWDGVMAMWFARDAINKWGGIGHGVRVGDINVR
jgi:hypothetical protein